MDPSGHKTPDLTDQFVRLLTKNERRVYAFILSVVHRAADADELLQETNIRLWRDFGKFEAGTDFCAWAIQVAKYQILTYQKRRARERLRFSDAFIDVIAAEVASVDADERHLALLKCMGELPERSRSVVEAYYGPDADGPSLAAKLGRSLDALHQMMSRLRRALHACVERRLRAQVQP